MNKINLTEATVLALQGKLLLDDNKAIKHESVDITANNGTSVSIDDNSTIISSPEASITLVNSNNDANVEVPVATDLELPVESDETIIPEDSIAEDTFTDEIVPDDSIENIDDENMNESIDTTKDFNITKYNEVMNLASDIANSLKDKEHLNLNDVIKTIENWDGGDTSVFTVIAKVDPELYKKLDDHNTENEDNRYEVENQFLGLVEDCLADMGKTVFDDDYYTESKKIERVKNAYTFEELADDIEDAKTYEDLYSCLLHIKNQNLRNQAYDHVEQSEKDGDSVKEAGSMLMSDVLEKYRFKDNSVNLQEKSCKLSEVSDLKYDVLTDREIDMANTDLNVILDDVKDNTIRPATIKSAEALLSNLIFWFKEANPDYNYKFDYIGESKKICNKLSKKLHESDNDDSIHEETEEAIESAKYTLDEIYDQVTRAAYSWAGLDDDIKNVLEDELSSSFGDDLQDASDTISDFMDSWDSYESDFVEELHDIYESRKKDEEDEEDTEDDDLDEAKSMKRNPKVNIASFENKLNEFYAKNNAKVRLDSVAMSSDHIKLEGVLQITDKSARRLCLEMKQLNTFKNKQSYILESTGRTIKKESQQSRVVMTITNNNGVLECSNIFNRKNK